MPAKRLVERLSQNERLNFLLTNRIPRRIATRFVGRISKIRHPLVSRPAIAVWRLFGGDFELHEARRQKFASMHELFTRELRPGMRPQMPDPAVLTSPCDAIVGETGRVEKGRAYQAKGFPYALHDLLSNESLVDLYDGGVYATLRLKSNMYHRFHAPCDGSIDGVTYISGDTWNVNPIALRRIENLYCRNERAVITIRNARDGLPITLVPVAAILVASIRLRFLDEPLSLKYRGPNYIDCKAEFSKGDELGWFEHGSTIIAFAPSQYTISDQVRQGERIRLGSALFAPADAR
jgi:phosphatidylserine decarboxylase